MRFEDCQSQEIGEGRERRLLQRVSTYYDGHAAWEFPGETMILMDAVLGDFDYQSKASFLSQDS